MADNKKLCKEILEAVGGTGNVDSVAHCMTRLRLTLKDTGAAQPMDEIKKIDGVLGVIAAGNMYQVVLGPGAVERAYLEMQKLGGFSAAGVVEDSAAAREDAGRSGKLTFKKGCMAVIDFISGSFMPTLPVILAGGLISAILVVCTTFFNMDPASGTYTILNSIYSAAFTFLPIYVGYNTAKKLNISPMLGALLGGVMVSEGITDAVGLTFLGIPVASVGYTNSILPVMLSVLFMSVVYRPLDKYLPQAVKFVLTPVLTMLVTVPVTLIVTGPLANWFGGLIATVMLWIQTNLNWFSVAVMSAWAPVMLFTGTGAPAYPMIFDSFDQNGFEGFIMTSLLAANLAIGGAALAASLRLRSKQNKSVAVSTGITAVFGITEPAIYGILVPYKKPFLAAIIGSAVGGLFAGITHVVEYSFASPGILTIIAFINPDGSMTNFFMAIATMVISFFVAFGLTWVMGVEEPEHT